MNTQKPHHISDDLIERSGLSFEVFNFISEQAEKYGLSRVVLFGSRARGDFRPKSDIDLAVMGGAIDLFALDLSDLSPTLLCFDVVKLTDTLDPQFLFEIERDGVVIYEKVR